MPIEHAVVGRILRIEPPVGESGAETLRRHPEGVVVTFTDATTVRIRAGDRPEITGGWLEILDELRTMGAPAFVETDPDSEAVIRLFVPLVAEVSRLSEGPDQVHVELRISEARHRVARSNPDFDALVGALETALGRGTRVIVTETFDHEIIDVRADPDGEDVGRVGGGPRPRGEPGAPLPMWRELAGWLRRFLDGLFELFRPLFCWICCVSPRRAQELFDLMAARSCDPLTVPVPCIPFLYPDDGCWGRAHEMSRLLRAEGACPRKVWIYGGLQVDTANNPNCYVNWGWHVAPIVCVRRWWFRCRMLVIDPSLFDTPVSEATWKSVQGDPAAVLERSSASVFYRSQGGGYTQTDPTYTQTNTVLANYRLQLKNRSLQFGPPPYACP